MKKNNTYLSEETITLLKPNILQAMNSIYSSNFELHDFKVGHFEDEKKSNLTNNFYLFATGPSHNLFHCKHILDSNTIHRLKFEKFDINLNQYLNNIFSFYLNFSHDTYIVLNSRISLNKIYRYSYLNKILKPSLKENSRMRMEINFHSKNRYYGKIFIYFKLIDNIFVVDNKEFLDKELKSLSGMKLINHQIINFHQNKNDFKNIF